MASAITVCSDTNRNNTCETASIDEALKSITSFTTLYFEPGTSYILQDFTLVRDLTNISLVGGGHTTIMCHQGVGLAFFNVSNLHIENVVITGCGIHGNATDNVQSAIKEVIEMFFRIPNETNIAMVLGSCTNVHLQHVTIAKTSGLGLLGVNVMGSSVLNDVNFTNNTWTVCKVARREAMLPDILLQQGGGGAIFLYHNYVNSSYNGAGPSLLINQNNFFGNSDCSPAGIVERYYRYSTDARETGYIVGGGGGLTLMIAQSTYYTEILVKCSVFRNNSARYGSGAHIGIFNDATNCDIQFSNCTFTHNGLPTDVFSTEQFSVGGAGLAILNDLFSPQYPISLRPTVPNKNVSITVKHSDFTNNSAYQGSGLYIFSHYTVSTVRNTSDVTSVSCNHCLFNSNVGAIGPAFFAYEAKLILTPGMYVEMSDFVITNNTVAPLENANFRSVGDSSAAIHFQSLVIVFKGKSEISHNHGTGVYGYNCNFVLSNYTNLTIAENVGDFGGGMRLISYSFLFLLSNSTLVFKNNVGTVRGGALYVSLQDDSNDPYFDCFVYAGGIETLSCNSVTSCSEFQDTGIKIAFSGNVASLGSIVYGSTLSTCLWVYALKYQNNYAGNDTAFEIIQRFIPNVVDIGDGPISINEVTTLPNRLTLTKSSLSAIPGQVFNISVAALDRFNQRAPSVITSTVQSTNGKGNTTSQLGVSGYYFVRKNTTTDIPLRVFGPANQTVVVGLYSVDSFADTQIMVNLEQCAPGFVYDDASSSCACLSDVTREGIECDPATQELGIPKHLWVGPIDEKYDTSIQLVHECIFDYCRPGRHTLAPPDYDTQCAEGYRRTGMLCGSCPHGYSVVFGTNRCLKCTNTYLLLLVAFTVAGIVLVLGISLLHITITNGYLNAILFYCNMISLYTTVFVPRSTAGAFVVVAYLNLNLGIETCFYDGMDALARAGLQLLFPAYLFFLMAAIVLLARIKYFKCFAHAEFSAVKMLGTLLILCYTSILQSCTEILGIVRIHTFSGETLVRWVVDPSVTYFQGWHGLLGSIALVLVVFYVSLFPILLLFPRYIYQIPYTKRLKPLYDALYNPFNAKARCWLGIRLILRSIPLVLAVFAQFPLNVFVLAIYLIALLYVQLLIKPFKEPVLNAVDNFLVANMIFLILGALYFDASGSNTCDENKESDTLSMQTTFSYVFVYIAYTVFAVILLYYIYLRLPGKCQNTIKTFLKKLLCCFHWEGEEEIEDITTSPTLPPTFDHVTHSSVRIPRRNELRTHLLEGNLNSDMTSI